MKPPISNQDITLLRELDSASPELREDACQTLLTKGSQLDSLISAEFPGQVAFDPLRSSGPPPPLKDCSGLLNYIVLRGPSATGLVLPHLSSDDPTARFFAVAFFHTFPQPEHLPLLSRRLYDQEPPVRSLAIKAIQSYRPGEHYTTLLKNLLIQLRVPLFKVKLGVIEVLGQLKEPTTVPALIALVDSQSAEVRTAAASSLTAICAQNFGEDRHKWSQWWKLNNAQPRESWLVTSLRHPNRALGKLSFSELERLTPTPLPLNRPTTRFNKSTVKELEQWWNTERPPESTTTSTTS